MSSTRASVFLACFSLSLGACKMPTLTEEPFTRSPPGSHILGAGAGYGWVDFDMELVASGAAFIDGMQGTDDGNLVPRSGGAIRYRYVVNRVFEMGASIEVRNVKPDDVAPLGIGPVLPEFKGDDLTTLHFMLSPRFYHEPIGESRRFRPFVGFDVAYIPKVDIDGEIVYGGGQMEPIRFRGDDYWTFAPVFGFSYQLADAWTVDFGGLWEFSIGETSDVVPLQVLSGATPTFVDSDVTHEGPIVFWTVNYHF